MDPTLLNPTLLSPGQTIATCQRNMSQHCWAQHVACVWPPCCDMLGVVGSGLKMVKFEPTTPNMSQHIATRWPNARNMLCPTMLRYVALACCDRLAGALDDVAHCRTRWPNECNMLDSTLGRARFGSNIGLPKKWRAIDRL